MSITGPIDWRERALCAKTDPDAFFPDMGRSATLPKWICARCPVREPCLKDAIANNELVGIRGGLSAKERRPLRRLHVAAA